jgi:hypothetical protein
VERLEPGWTRRSRPLSGVRLLAGPGCYHCLELLLALSPLLARVLLLSVVMLPVLPCSVKAGIRYCVCAGSAVGSGQDKIVEEEGRLHDTVWGFAALGQNAVDWVGNVEHVGGRPWHWPAWYMLADGLDTLGKKRRTLVLIILQLKWGLLAIRGVIQEERSPGRCVVNCRFDRVAYIVLDGELRESWMSPIVQSCSKMVWGSPYGVSPLQRPVGVSVSLCIDVNVLTLRS